MNKTFFISDLHFGHKNVLAFDNRKFPSIEEHDEALIHNWNEVVDSGDDVYILGDISWYGPEKTVEILNRLNGIKHLCVGNHDHKLLRNADVCACFAEIVPYREITVDGYGVVLCHYPIPCYNNHYYGWIHLYGHVHNSMEWNMMKHIAYQMRDLYDKPCRMYNVGCMIPGMDYTPRTLSEIMEHADEVTAERKAGAEK